MDYGILGPLAVWQDGREIELGAAKQRALLAVMLLHAGETMSSERLVDALWGEHPPATAVKAMQVYVSQLRKTLGDGVVVTRQRGYVLELEDDALDLHRFERLLDEGRQRLAAGSALEASDVLRQALALWRGEPLADFRYEAFAANAIARLEELRLLALEQALEADLAAGRHTEAVPELEALVRAHPLRESLRGLLMRALYRSERQADALAVMQDARATLRDELGLDPGQPLQQLEKAILMQDAALDLPAAAPVQPTVPAPPAEPTAPRQQRRVVTVLSAELTAPEAMDPEAMQTLVERCVERTGAAVDAYGGSVEERLGDRLIAVFGLRAVHEDDALRALRSAVELSACAAALGLESRIGVESGEVIAGGTERSVAGAPVSGAARLEQAARAGEVLLGEGAMGLAREAVTAEPVEPEPGRPPLAAWRLVGMSDEAPSRTFDSPFVDREHELRTLVEAWERVRTGTQCELVTVVGTAGLGKSRLVAEFTARSGGQVVHGRCLSYGAGITYWPVLEALGQLRPHLDGLDPAIGTPLAVLLGEPGAGDANTASTDELAWAFRKLAEKAAADTALVLVFDDLQWGEDALLDLVEHVAFVSAGAPILLLCMARPDLLERRPGWRGVLHLEPLTRDDAELLLDARLGDAERDAATVGQIVTTAGGNPLFVEELASMLQQSGTGRVAMPPTIQALLAARLDQLDPGERAVLEAAAVEGEIFHRGAVQALAPGEPRVMAQLTSLVRKDIVRPDRPELEGEDGFRFRHLLLREVAYDAIPKSARSELHERFGRWLDERDSSADALVGHHLERSYSYRAEIGTAGPDADGLALEASERLARAGATALARGDIGALRALYTRAAALPPVPDARRAQLLVDLAGALIDAGELPDADVVLADAGAAGEAAGDEVAAARVLVELHLLAVHRVEPGAIEKVPSVVDGSLPLFERAGDERGLNRAWQLRALADWTCGRLSGATDGWEQAAEHARRSGDDSEVAMILRGLASAAWLGPMPVEAGIAKCAEIRAAVSHHRASAAEVLRPLAGLHGFAGRFELARELFADANAVFEELGLEVSRALSHTEAAVEMLAGNAETAEALLRPGYDILAAKGETGLRSTTAALLARTLVPQGRLAEAEQFSEEAEQLAEPDDLVTQILWRGVRARLLAGRGELEEAIRLGREAVAIAERTTFTNFHADALVDLASVLDMSGRRAETPAIVAEALRLYTEKGNVVAARAARASLDAHAAV